MYAKYGGGIWKYLTHYSTKGFIKLMKIYYTQKVNSMFSHLECTITSFFLRHECRKGTILKVEMTEQFEVKGKY